MSFEHQQKAANKQTAAKSSDTTAAAGSAANQASMSSSQQQQLQLQQAVGNQAALQLQRGQAAQRKADGGPAEGGAASGGLGGGKLPLPMYDKIQAAFNVDPSSVNIHANSSEASKVGALAYTQGNDIHFAPGQYNPESSQGQELIGHEMTHVVQQRAGKVKPTTEISGMPVNDDPKLEREAESMGRRTAAASSPVQRSADPTAAASASSGGGSHAKTPIQRLPTRRQMEKELNPKSNFLFIKNSTRVKSFLSLLDKFNNYVDGTDVGRTADAIKKQMVVLKSLYGSIEQSALQYIESKEEGGKQDAMAQFVERLKRERALMLLKAQNFVDSPPDLPPKWFIVMTSLRGMDPTTIKDINKTGESGSGALNSVDFVNLGDREGVFKGDKQRIVEGSELQDASEAEKRSADTEHWVASKMAKINTNDAHMAARNVAASRLDKWLGAGVIAHAEFALHESGGAVKSGSFMEKAKGQQAGKFETTTIDFADPVLQRSLSRLQLMDALCMQVDRHTGNFFVQTDDSGNVLGITGIDNDMSFGERTEVHKGSQEYPGLSRFVDKDLAERIIALQDDDLIFIVADLLSAAEVKALLTRLSLLKAHLKKLKSEGKLLDAGDWNKQTSDDQMEEKTNYLNNFNWKLSKT
ncbi:eCIS core domain-containing protein [Paenibacillus sp. YIM B09110]|uniref:eCIS core domain-containing protein n=1 Tax=Paenibacillus sp. YIM B09110 TaxID=3126102 RepID=UPI00301DD620